MIEQRRRFIEMYVVAYLANFNMNGSYTSSGRVPISDAIFSAEQTWEALIEHRNNSLIHEIFIENDDTVSTEFPTGYY